MPGCTATFESKARRPYTEDPQIPNQKRKHRDHQLAYHCLVIDDQSVVLDLVAAMLSKLGYRVDTAGDKLDVLSMLNSNSYDLIVTDLKMPDMNGYRLAVEVKKKNRTKKVVVMTGCPESDCTVMMGTGWADGWLFKPFGLNELIHMLGELGLSRP